MRFLFLTFSILVFSSSFAQKPCDYVANVSDSIGIYKETPDYLISERIFGDSTSLIYFSLAQTDGMPTLNVQFFNKSKDFIKVKCLDKNSRLFITLDSGKIVTLVHVDQDNCGTNIRNQGVNNRIMNGVFMFLKGSLEDLKSSPMSTIRIRYATDTEDVILKKSFKSEFDTKTYEPSTYLMNYLRCVE